MILRYFADVLVILGCGYIGITLASTMDKRIHQLEKMEQMLTQLAFNIGFLSLPLPEAMRRTGESQQGIVQLIMQHVTGLMQNFPHISMGEAWEESIHACRDSLELQQEELSALRDFAQHIGQGDGQTELDNIHLTQAKLKLCMEEARAKRQKDGKLYKGLGFLSGILIVLLLA